MRKYKLISALAEETAKEVVRNEENWRRYLNTASRLYKYPFKEQLLIYAQRPEATACASIEIWNEKMHCWVNKGAKGIALIDEDSFSGLKYVFDISDVHKARRIGQFPNLWEMREEHMESVISRLEKTYGDTDREAGFVGRIREIAGRIAEDCYKELASDMEYLKEGSFLEELDELNVEIRIRETLADSIAYTVLKRCGMEESELAEEINFPYIHEFNTVETLSQLGSNVSDLSKPILMEIGKAIGAYDRQIAQNREETRVGRERIDTHEKNIEKGLANASEADYNALKRESENEANKMETEEGHGYENGPAASRPAQLAAPAAGKGILHRKALSAVVLAQVPLGKDPEGRTAPLRPVLPCHAAYAPPPGRGNGLAGEQGDKPEAGGEPSGRADPEARRDLQLLAAYRQAYGPERL